VNTNPTVASRRRSVTRAATLGACLVLAACGDSQNYQDHSAYLTVGGNVSGLTGTVTLLNTIKQTGKSGKTTTGTDTLGVTANGPFTFGLQLANGSTYAVTITTQPRGQVCTITGGTGTATANVTSITVTCKSDVTIGGTISGLTGTVVLLQNGGNALATASNGPFTFTAPVQDGSVYAVLVRDQPIGQACSTENYTGVATANVTNVAVVCKNFAVRPLDAKFPDDKNVYSTGQSINYSAYRAGGPAEGEIPSDTDVVQDLGLLHNAGFNLLRLFGADDVAEKILRLANQYYPEMRFQQGLALFGIAPNNAGSCMDDYGGANDAQVARAIALANTYPNVVTVSVGNETSFFSKYMPTICLTNFITRVRNNVAQPVTADDDWTFYAGLTQAGGTRAAVKPDTVLPLIDFVSIHSYAILNAWNPPPQASPPAPWDWWQTAFPAGQVRAEKMMNASLAYAKNTYTNVANYSYTNAAGVKVTTGDTLPITIGETGWKAVQTNPDSAIEHDAALPVNQKWYYDLMNTWQAGAVGDPPRGTVGGPPTVFFFEAFDEAWKGIDDGWGLWTAARAPRYALCGTPAGSPCIPPPDTYQGAGYYNGP